MRRQFSLIIAALAAAALVALAYVLAARKASDDIAAQSQLQLQLMAPALESALEKFETLPFVLSFQSELIQALARPLEVKALERVNRNLQTIQRQAKISAIYLLAADGNTVAASNWDQSSSFIGKNFAYRPYFRSAIGGNTGRFYGIGNTTSEAGYFIAEPVRVGGAVAGVVVVKISLAEFERSWSSSAAPIVLSDRRGVALLTNRGAWKYRSLAPSRPRSSRNWRVPSSFPATR
ncbi:C4-dicarboxylate-specific signal transduction histidine kinase [Oxalobacteraceae bacterium GrIS 1.11]